jgi:hypothetical protein
MKDNQLLTNLSAEYAALKVQEDAIKKAVKVKKGELLAELFNYHKILIDVLFYDNYKMFSHAKSLKQMFNLGSWTSWLPYADHGEGDYVKIDFKVSSGKLNLVYKCSYRKENNCSLIRIPLDLFTEDKREELIIFLNESYATAQKIREGILNDAKKKEIAELKDKVKLLEGN